MTLPHFCSASLRSSGRRHPLQRRRFTLIEMMVSMVLLGAVLVLVMMGSSTAIGAWSRVDAEARRLDGLTRLDRSLDTILGNIVPFSWPDESTREEILQFHGDDSSIYLTYRHTLNRLEDGTLRFCRLSQEDDRLTARYCERPPLPEDTDDERWSVSTLASGVSEIRLAYADLNEESLDWLDRWEDKTYLPLAVRLTVTWTDGDTTSWIRRPAGMAAYERQGAWTQTEGGSSRPQIEGGNRR